MASTASSFGSSGPSPVRSVERFAGNLFGIVGRGAHLTVYTHEEDGSMRIWVPRRAVTSFTLPGMLDTTVAGGVPDHQSPFHNVIQEAAEEASLPEGLVRRCARAVGVLTYMGRSAEGLACPDVIYVHDLEVGKEVVPVPYDGEVKEFHLMTVDEVQHAMAQEEFKPNSVIIMVGFLIRHNFTTAENEEIYIENAARMHGKQPFPVTAESPGLQCFLETL